MKRFFLCILLAFCFWLPSHAELTIANDQPDLVRCNANFRFDSIIGFVFQFEDFSWSTSHIIEREWNFGDLSSGMKNVSHHKNPWHVFSGNGIYHVCLKIRSISNCTDSIVKDIVIGPSSYNVYISGHILNSASGGPVPGQPVNITSDIIHYSTIRQTNMYGFYQDTIPDVPIGTPIIISVFDCNDSLHTQTIHASGQPIEVNFNICAVNPCNAGFTFRLDSTNVTQNTFIFTDTSGGNPDYWFWNFGDGEDSHDQNPVHSYKNPGHYYACLTVMKKDLYGQILCTDSACHEIVTPSYYNLGGLAFAGLYPINNPSSTGDTGVAYLYRIQTNKFVPVDTMRFTYLGYYAFLHLLEGKYLVKVSLTKGSSHFSENLPVYTGDLMRWQSAEPIELSGGNSFANDIHFFRGTDDSGPGTIGGYVSHRDKDELVRQTEVILYDEALNPVLWTISDDDGKFDFSSIGYGKYFLYAEMTGKYSRLQEVTINENIPSANGVVVELSDVDFTGINPLTKPGDLCVQVFPNPFTDLLHIRIGNGLKGTVTLSICGLTGNEILSKTSGLETGNVDLEIPLGDLPRGLYFLTVTSDDGTKIAARKIVKD